MRRIREACAAATIALIGLSPAGTWAACNAACEVTRLGWVVVEPGPPLWFRTNIGPRLEVAVAGPARPPGGEPIPWAKTRLAGHKGMFGPLGTCKGDFPAGARKVTGLVCKAPPGADGPRQGAVFLVDTADGLAVIGLVAPASVRSSQINYSPLSSLAAEGRGAVTLARAARSAIAMFTGGSYYIADEVGAAGPAIDAVYHLWNWQLVNSGMVDQGADFVLFKSGEAWRNPGAGPRDVDPVRFKEARWNDWGTWGKDGRGIVITLNDQAPMLMPANNFERYNPATAADQHVEGRWRWSTYFRNSATSGGTERSISLHADGRWEQNGFSGFADEHSTVGAGAPASNGHYRIDGYTLDVTYEDGRKTSALFYWAGDARNNLYSMFMMNGARYLGGLSH